MLGAKIVTKTIKAVNISKFEKMLEFAEETQIQTLRRIISYNKNTLFGKAHNFGEIHTIRDFQHNVPIYNYYKLRPYIRQILSGKTNVLFSDRQMWWVKSSGTTGDPKLYPITESRITGDQKIGTRMVLSYLLWDKENIKILKGKMLSFTATAIIEYINNIPVGYISGVMAATQSRLIKHLMAIPQYVINITDPSKKYYETLVHALKNNITLISGASSFIVKALKFLFDPEMMSKVLDDPRVKVSQKANISILYSNAKNYKVKDIWNNLRLIAWSAVDIKPYKKWFNQYVGDVDFFEFYTGSEGMYAFQLYENENLVLNVDKYFFEFVPEEEWSNKQHPRRLTISEVKKGHRYVLLVTSSSGLYSYTIDDVIEVVKTDPVMIRVIGKVGRVLNIATEKITEKEINMALNVAAERTNSVIGEYIVVPKIANGQGRYQFYINFQKHPPDVSLFENALDQALKEINYVYQLVRDEDILGKPNVQLVSDIFFNIIERRLLENGKPLGQYKPLHIEEVEPFDLFMRDINA
ncbi:MAG: GH3 auxin-responsive promoter family protein [Candidatus Asgardarchaeia archaeon]